MLTRYRFLSALCLLGAWSAGPVLASGDRPEVREGYEDISPLEFRRLPANTPEGKRYTISYIKFNKLFVGKELKIYGGVKDGRLLRSHLSGLLQIEQKRSRERLIANLKGNRDSDGNPLTPKKTNIQVFGVGRQTPDGYVLLVNRVHRLGPVAEFYTDLAKSLPPSDAQERLDLVRRIDLATRYHPEDAKALESLVERLRQEARDAEFKGLPELPEGIGDYIRFARRHEEIGILDQIWKHEQVTQEDKARAADALRVPLNAVLYLGSWYPYDAFKERLGFASEDGRWVPRGLVELKERAAAEKKRRGKLEIGGGQLDRKLLEVAMRKGDVIAGMTKDMVVAARGSFPVDVQRWREELARGTLVWERWELEDGYRVFFCNSVAFLKIKAGEEPK